jgi:hypothetical protein
MAASAALAATALACTDAGLVDDPTLETADLVILGLQATGQPVSSVSAYVTNGAETFLRIRHNDQFRTLYVELRFPSDALVDLGGQPIAFGDSVLVGLEPEPDAYGVTLTPLALALASSSAPYATFSFATYGDLSVVDGSPRYATRSAYASALALWFETAPGHWERVVGSVATGSDAVGARLREPGRYVVAAPR